MFAIYRCLYGEDFIVQSINSIIDVVDKILVVWDDQVWGDVKGCVYKNKYIEYPFKFDNIIEKIASIGSDKIILHKDHVFSPFGHHEHIISNILPQYRWCGDTETIMIMEVDMVFRRDQLDLFLKEFEENTDYNLYTKQIEIWKYKYKIPERDRHGVKLMRKGISQWKYSSAYVHNMGFSFSDKTMYWKHLTAIGFSPIIGDSLPNPNWYDDKWLNWNYQTNNENLEISIGCEGNIPYAVEYPIQELPQSIKELIE